MGDNSAIEWTKHTFNPWWGCAHVSPGCRFCYAERDARRYGHDVWGKLGPRRMLSEKNWAMPLRWNREAEQAGTPARVFCASMADVFEDHPAVVEPRKRLWPLIEATPWLRWQLLTKRPENVAEMVPWGEQWPPHVWLGTSVEDQQRADERIPKLLETKAAVRFLSCEPLLSPVDLSAWLTPIIPIAPEAAPKTWAEWTWPSWVPAAVAHQVEEFWSEKWGRGPRAWLKDAIEQEAHSFGAMISSPDGFGQNAPLTQGRYVHAWNNVGRLVRDDGTFAYTSFTPREVRAQRPLNWVIVGGESGPGARPMDLAWARSLVQQCRAAGVAPFVKQLGAHPYDSGNGNLPWLCRSAKGDGDISEFPADLRIREYPR